MALWGDLSEKAKLAIILLVVGVAAYLANGIVTGQWGNGRSDGYDCHEIHGANGYRETLCTDPKDPGRPPFNP